MCVAARPSSTGDRRIVDRAMERLRNGRPLGAGTKRPWRLGLWPGKAAHRLVPGLATNAVVGRRRRLAGLVGRENVIASTDCGFAQSPFHRRVHPTIQWAKLGALVEGAKLASQRLWKR